MYCVFFFNDFLNKRLTLTLTWLVPFYVAINNSSCNCCFWKFFVPLHKAINTFLAINASGKKKLVPFHEPINTSSCNQCWKWDILAPRLFDAEVLASTCFGAEHFDAETFWCPYNVFMVEELELSWMELSLHLHDSACKIFFVTLWLICYRVDFSVCLLKENLINICLCNSFY